jgi:Mg-chelatase subunit ChlD
VRRLLGFAAGDVSRIAAFARGLGLGLAAAGLAAGLHGARPTPASSWVGSRDRDLLRQAEALEGRRAFADLARLLAEPLSRELAPATLRRLRESHYAAQLELAAAAPAGARCGRLGEAVAFGTGHALDVRLAASLLDWCRSHPAERWQPPSWRAEIRRVLWPAAQRLVVDVDVRDARSRAVMGLRSEDFLALASGAPARVVEARWMDAAAPPVRHLALVLDTSASMRPFFEQARLGAQYVVGGLREGDGIALIASGPGPRRVLDWAKTRYPALRALAGLRPAGRASVYDALGLALHELRGRAGATAVLVTAGRDSPGNRGRTEILERLRVSGVRTLVIALRSSPDGRSLLQEIATASDGLYREVTDDTDSGSPFEAVRRQIEAEPFYRLCIESPRPLTRLTEVAVTVRGRPAADAREDMS